MAKRRKKKNPENKNYFTKTTENAIIRYNDTSDQEEREYLFNTYIHKPLDKIAENIINRFKFMYTHLPYEDLKSQVVSFLVINLHKYNNEKGNAFSYFSIIAKNYLIFQNNTGWKDEKNKIYLSEVDEESPEDWLLVGNEHKEHQHEMKDFVKLFVNYWEKNVDNFFKKTRDVEIASNIIQLLKNSDGIDAINKKSCYLMIRQMGNGEFKTSTITKVINQMKDKVYEQLEEYRSTGSIS